MLVIDALLICAALENPFDVICVITISRISRWQRPDKRARGQNCRAQATLQASHCHHCSIEGILYLQTPGSKKCSIIIRLTVWNPVQCDVFWNSDWLMFYNLLLSLGIQAGHRKNFHDFSYFAGYVLLAAF